jgi:hypothetical protein
VAPLAREGSIVRLRILLDRGSIEVFGNDGRVAISRALARGGEKSGLVGFVPAGSADVKLRSMRVLRAELGLAVSDRACLACDAGPTHSTSLRNLGVRQHRLAAGVDRGFQKRFHNFGPSTW